MTFEWMTKQMMRAVLCKKEFIRMKKPGAIIHNKPKFIWIKMFAHTINNRTKIIADKFNTCLMEIIQQTENHFIMDLNASMQEQSLYMNNHLNGFGRVRFWREFDRQIECFDYKRISLRPGVQGDGRPEQPTFKQEFQKLQGKHSFRRNKKFWKKANKQQV